MKKLFRKFIAHMRWNLRIVCEESEGKGLHDDYHDYPDDDGIPTHGYTYHCRRCGKAFQI